MNEQEQFAEARKRLAERFGEALRLGGKGTQRRKVKVQQPSAADDKKVKGLAKKLSAQPTPEIAEVNFFKEDGTYMNFKNPEFFMNYAHQTLVFGGEHQVKGVQENLAEILTQLSPAQLEAVRAAVVAGAAAPTEAPPLVNFEDAVAGQ